MIKFIDPKGLFRDNVFVQNIRRDKNGRCNNSDEGIGNNSAASVWLGRDIDDCDRLSDRSNSSFARVDVKLQKGEVNNEKDYFNIFMCGFVAVYCAAFLVIVKVADIVGSWFR